MNTRGYDHGGEKYESYFQRKGLGDRSVAKRGPYHIASGQEYRTRNLGHVTIDITDRYIPAKGFTDSTDAGPSLGVIADQVHALNGFIGLAHGGYHNQEADGLLLDGKMDFLELLQFGGYRSLGLRGWYDFLNIGFRLPMVGASDFPPTRELASEMTYVWSEQTPTPRSFMEAITAGRSFGTSGPMLFTKVSGRRPGELITLDAGTDTTLVVDIDVVSPIYPVRYIEIIVNGRITDRHFSAEARTRWALQTHVDISETSWVAVRTYGDAGTEAHTNPVYVYVGGNRQFDNDSARNIIARLNGSIEHIEVKEVVDNLNRLKHVLERMLAGKSGSLPLPAIPE